ncbi:MAG: hypothetical protein WA828_19165, partial [Coleofasciculaceae cyanobacterium]
GGIAGSASFQLNGNQVQAAAVSAAVGKDTAYAGANAVPITAGGFALDAFAAGTAGTVTTNGRNNYVTTITPDNSRGVAQSNVIGGSIGIDALTGQTVGNVDVTVSR